MKPHVKLYFKHFGYDETDFISCEICGAKSVDIHHVNARGMGGTKESDNIKNLMALCRECHLKYGDKKQYLEFLKEAHNEKLRNG